MSREFKDNTDEISNKVKMIIKKKMVLYRDLLEHFLELKKMFFYSKWDEIKKKIEESKEEIAIKIDNSKEEIKNKINSSNAEIRGMLDTSKKNYQRLHRKKEEK